MNRLSKDMETIDQELPSGTMFFVLEIFGCVFCLLLTSGAVSTLTPADSL
jgi:hypothetical protein